jgi:hypothetical protein
MTGGRSARMSRAAQPGHAIVGSASGPTGGAQIRCWTHQCGLRSGGPRPVRGRSEPESAALEILPITHAQRATMGAVRRRGGVGRICAWRVAAHVALANFAPRCRAREPTARGSAYAACSSWKLAPRRTAAWRCRARFAPLWRTIRQLDRDSHTETAASGASRVGRPATCSDGPRRTASRCWSRRARCSACAAMASRTSSP